MKYLSRFLFALVAYFISLQVFAAENIPAFLKDFPHTAFHRQMSNQESVGKTEFRWKAEGDKLSFFEKSEMKLTLFKKAQLISTDVKVITNSKIEIQSFDFHMTSLEASIEIVGERSGDQLKMRVTQAGKTQTKVLPIQEPLLISPTIRPFILMKGLPADKAQLQAFILEPSALTTVPLTINLVKKSSNRWAATIGYLSHELISEIDGVGNLLSEKADFAGLPVEAVPTTEPALEKLVLDGTRQDLVDLAKVSFPTIPMARTIKNFSVRISGVDLKGFELNRNRQKFENDILTVKTEEISKVATPVQSLVGQKSLERYLEGDTSLPVYDPVIQRKAREIVQNESDLWKRAMKIHDFVFKELEKVPTISVPNALEVLATKRGDCNEHAVLYTALARAVGVPTRTVVGLVYSDRFYGEPGFYYHAWVEVYNGKEWISIDPTWNQVPSDATHLAFVEGGLDQQVQVTALMGKIKLEPVGLSSAVPSQPAEPVTTSTTPAPKKKKK